MPAKNRKKNKKKKGDFLAGVCPRKIGKKIIQYLGCLSFVNAFKFRLGWNSACDYFYNGVIIFCLFVLVVQPNLCHGHCHGHCHRRRIKVRTIKVITIRKMSGAMPPPPLPITPGRPVSYRRYLTGAFEFYQDRYLEELELRMPLTHGQKKHVVKTCQGDERMMALRKTLNQLGYELSLIHI